MVGKDLYKGTFNWHGEIHYLHKHAGNAESAFTLMLLNLSIILKTSVRNIRFYFNGSKDNFILEKVKRKRKDRL